MERQFVCFVNQESSNAENANISISLPKKKKKKTVSLVAKPLLILFPK
jgi:hypothetical protein